MPEPHMTLGHFHFLVGWQQDKLQPGQTQPESLLGGGGVRESVIGRRELFKITGIFQAALQQAGLAGL